MKILVISNNYPSIESPTYGVFVYNFIQQLAILGHQITVIAVRSLLKKQFFKKKIHNYGTELATVYRPYVLSASNKQILTYNTHLIGEYFQVSAIKKLVKNNELEFDVIYAHFLANGIVAVKALSDYNKPIFVAEGEFRNINIRKSYYRPKAYAKMISEINAFIAVSRQIEKNLVQIGVNKTNIIVEPNGVDLNLFFKRNKLEMRKKFKLPLNKKLIVFLGRFVNDKGPLRVLNAVEDSTLKNLGIIYIGNGSQILESEKIVFKDKVVSNLVPELLSAADLFVLPTLHEGSCNAILEAIACGLPIVSSDIPEIREQCDPSFSILVDPMNVTSITVAIEKIVSSDELQEKMGSSAIAYSKHFDITKRAKRVLTYIENKI